MGVYVHIYFCMNIRKIIREEQDEFDWIRGTGLPVNITEIGPGEHYRIVYADGEALDDLNNESEVKRMIRDYEVDSIYDITFKMDDNDGFLTLSEHGPDHETTTDYATYHTGLFWLLTPEDSYGEWISVDTIKVIRVHDEDGYINWMSKK